MALALRGWRTSRVVTIKPLTATYGITIVGVVYMLAAFVTTALVPIDVLRDSNQEAPKLAPIHAERLGKGLTVRFSRASGRVTFTAALAIITETKGVKPPM